MQRYFVKNINNKIVNFEEGDIHHIKNVMRMKLDDIVECVYKNELYQGKITSLEPLEVKIIKKIEIQKYNKPKIIMIIPLLIESKMDYILQKCTELGIDEFHIYEACRSKIKLNQEMFSKKVNRWSRICKEASEQSHRINIPTIKGLYKISDLKSEEGLNLICSTNISKNFKNTLKNHPNCGRINIVVGPEGGLDPKEEELLVSFGYLKTSLGPTILRAETAPICVLSYLNYEFME